MHLQMLETARREGNNKICFNENKIYIVLVLFRLDENNICTAHSKDKLTGNIL